MKFEWISTRKLKKEIDFLTKRQDLMFKWMGIQEEANKEQSEFNHLIKELIFKK